MDPTALKRLCQLARLELTAPEQADFARKFEGLLGFVDKVQSFDTSGTPASTEHDIALELRRDLPQVFDWPQSTIHNYRVPQVIDFEDAQ